MKSFELYEPTTIEEAVGILTKLGPKAKVLAGGSDLVTGIMKDWVQGTGMPLPDALVTARSEVEVDIGTGSVLVTNFVAVHDVGQAINPFAVEQQIEGGVVMALGAVFTEEMLIDKGTGLPLNPNMLDYKALSILDVPDTIDVVIVERPKAYGVFGAHGIGEPPMSPPAPAVAAAIHNAVGVWMLHMPVTREKLLAELKNVR